jgi:hypothetical protein
MRLNIRAEEQLPNEKSESTLQILGILYHTESDIHKIKPKIFKLLKHINKYIKESASINPSPSK